ncbi:MAG: hypothetical protein CME06_12300 [Gemmatimonadetes bacterium]|nr:hypothetical protein [Gemmatimonadota bacterium]
MSSSRLMRLEAVKRRFRTPSGGSLAILSGVDLELQVGEIVAITGESGVGKSTLLNLCGLLDSPTDGRIELAGRDAGTLTPAERAGLRSEFIGFVFQFHHLLGEFNALENVMMPAMIRGKLTVVERARAMELLRGVGVADRADHSPATLSGGERQRVALARAMMNRPSLVLADEPTGNLDTATAASVQSLLLDTVRNEGRSMVLVTHDRELAGRADRHLVLSGGRLESAALFGERGVQSNPGV